MFNLALVLFLAAPAYPWGPSGHRIGDIHQPLQAAERSCDKGGNLERVNFDRKEANVAMFGTLPNLNY
jgi:hypothetical protein